MNPLLTILGSDIEAEDMEYEELKDSINGAFNKVYDSQQSDIAVNKYDKDSLQAIRIDNKNLGQLIKASVTVDNQEYQAILIHSKDPKGNVKIIELLINPDIQGVDDQKPARLFSVSSTGATSVKNINDIKASEIYEASK